MLNNILFLFALLSIFLLVFYFMNKPNQFLYYLMLIKPFIDLTVNVPLTGSINALQISGSIVFLVAGFLYISKYSSIPHENHSIIWIFLGIQLLTFLIAFINENQSLQNTLDYLVRIFEGYFIYFCSRQIMSDEIRRRKYYKMVWLTTLSISIITILSYWFGVYSVDITRGVVRVGGLYNDPGSPSYITVISLIFGTLYRDLRNRKNFNLNLIYFFNILVSSYVMAITVTKSAFLMLLVFIILWWGIYKNKLLFVLPIIFVTGYVAYTEIDTVQKRLETEVRFMEERTEEAAISMGTGRYGRWERISSTYFNEFSFYQKLFGSSRNYNAHNQFLAYLMQSGIIGFSMFMLIILNFYRRLIRIYKQNKNKEVFTAIALLSCFLTLGISGHPFDYTTIVWYLTIMLGIVNIQEFKVKGPILKSKRIGYAFSKRVLNKS